MALSRSTAAKIVDVVTRDKESFHRITAFFGIAPPPHIAGGIQNFILASTPGVDPSDPNSFGFKVSCDGISLAMAAAINVAVARGEIPDVAEAKDQARLEPISHTGTAIRMKDGTKYVFDWHKTLNVSNPAIYEFEDFIENRVNSDMLFSNFKGFPRQRLDAQQIKQMQRQLDRTRPRF
jgi:hypothetical protein